jgi:hypothetical protein
VQQLGPIGAAIQARLGEAQEEPQRALLQGQKDLALGLYERLSAYLAFEADVQVGGWGGSASWGGGGGLGDAAGEGGGGVCGGGVCGCLRRLQLYVGVWGGAFGEAVSLGRGF